MARGTRGGAAGDRLDWVVRADDAQAVPPLRREIMDVLRRRATPDGDYASAELVIGELLSNAVAHGPAHARVTLRWDGEHPVLSVADVGRGAATVRLTDDLAQPARPEPGLLEPALPEDPLADGGRGLFIADQLSRGLAVRTRATGSVISATLNLRRRPGPAAGVGQIAATSSARPA